MRRVYYTIFSPFVLLPYISYHVSSSRLAQFLRGSDISTIIIAEMVTPWELLPGIENVPFCTAVAQSTSAYDFIIL